MSQYAPATPDSINFELEEIDMHLQRALTASNRQEVYAQVRQARQRIYGTRQQIEARQSAQRKIHAKKKRKQQK